MSKYTTGELAKLCGISVRTVQFYDNKGVLCPSELSDGGRRLYSQEDLNKMRIICYLKELGLQLGTIKNIIREENSKEVLSLLLEEQKNNLKNDIQQKQKALKKLESLQSIVNDSEQFSVEDMCGVAKIMNKENNKKKFFAVLLSVAIPVELAEIALILLWAIKGIWLPFAIGMPVILVILSLLTWWYFGKVEYICPNCKSTFRPKFWQFFFAMHTPKTRKLTCTECGKKSYCIEKIK